MIKKIFIWLFLLFFVFESYADDIFIKAWVDLPKEGLSLSSEIQDQNILLINKSIKKYHEIDKLKIDNLSSRINLLSQIKGEVDRLFEVNRNKPQYAFLKKFSKMIEKKVWYLKSLEDIYHNKKDDYKFLLDYHTDIANIDKSYQPIFLVNKLMFDPKLPGHWGLYWMETIDPCHRQLMPYYVNWINSDQYKKVPFFIWLEEQNIPFYIPQVKLLSEQELEKHKVNVINGILLDHKGNRLNINDAKEYLFVINAMKELLIAEGNSLIHHVSLSKGKPVLATGTIKIKNGYISYIDMESGHYLPNITHALQTIKLLKELNIKASDESIIGYYHDYKFVKETLKEFEKKVPSNKDLCTPYYNEAEFNNSASLR